MLIMVAATEGVLIQSIQFFTHFPNVLLGEGSGVRGVNEPTSLRANLQNQPLGNIITLKEMC